MKVGFIGLGMIGSGMARSLIKAGHALVVFHRTRSRAQELAQLGATVAATPGEAAGNAEVLITMLADDHVLGRRHSWSGASSSVAAGGRYTRRNEHDQCSYVTTTPGSPPRKATALCRCSGVWPSRGG